MYSKNVSHEALIFVHVQILYEFLFPLVLLQIFHFMDLNKFEVM